MRLNWLEPLIEHFKNDATLTDIGRYVLPMSEYVGITTKNQFSPAIWVIPRAAKTTDSKVFCKARVEQTILICSVVKNPTSHDTHIGHDTELFGSYIQCAELEQRVRDSILVFNNIIEADPANYLFTSLLLTDLPEPDEHNGHFILGSIYKTKFTF